MPERITDLTSPPVVGRRYRVPCVMSTQWDRRWIPVTGPPHDDPELIDVPNLTPHWHFDMRFISDTLWRHLWGDYDLGSPHRMAYLVYSDRVFRGPEWVVRVCHREQLEFPMRAKLATRGTSGPVKVLEPAYVGRRVKCMTCPHRGVYLGNLPRVNGSVVICPGHGLAVDLAEGRVIGRADLAARREGEQNG